LQSSLSVAVGSGGWIFFDGTNWTAVIGGGGGGGSGTVTSIGLSMPAEFSVSGSPVTTAGTISVTKANQSANQVYAGPTGGGAAAPAFRALVQADLPAQPYDLGLEIASKPPANTRYIVWKFVRTVTFPANFSGSLGQCLTNPTGSVTF